ncbi:hypothetical protein C3942_14690 [Solimonas fluminis]|uniref:Replication-associated protein ORF2/G2P domain-containing protein n=2 Tax=Solimonas fluminis TaxID=2086571 RepID=A0A2S5TDJ2_9GAMM|nr:hypothetical protein C3942_14690 [Solimonas fluminis]
MLRAWVDFLVDTDLPIFATLTFRRPVTQRTALRSFREMIDFTNRKLYGTRCWKKPNLLLRWAVVVERGVEGLLHVHALLDAPERDLVLATRHLERVWRKYQGIAQIGPVRSSERCVRYLCKTLPQDGQVELSRNLKKFPK